MRELGGDQITEAVAGCVEALRPAVARDWTEVTAGGLDWNCHDTAVHVASDFIGYAGNLAGRAQDRYVPFRIKPDEGIDNSGLLHVIETTGALLAATVRTASRQVRAFHSFPFRSADRAGFAGMGIAEVLLHTHDMTRGLGLPYRPAEELAEYVLTYLFPHVQPGPTPWQTLLWATGRGELPGRTPVTEWRWNNNLVIPAERLDLVGIRPAEARDLRLGGDGGFEWIEGGPYEGTRDAAGFLLKAYEGGAHRAEFGVFALVRREDGRTVGEIGFHSAPDEEGRVEIGYDLAEAARGDGYATEALRALADWAFARDDVTSLFATVGTANASSRAVVTRAGFTRVSEDDKGLVFELRPE